MVRGQFSASADVGSTTSNVCTREHQVQVVQADFVPPAQEISADYEAARQKLMGQFR